jgi:uncharacterized membrane protein
MALGPVEMLIVNFPGNEFSGEIAPALAELVETETIRIIDLVFIRKDSDGTVEAIELADLDVNEAAKYSPFIDELSGLFSDEDIQELAQLVEKNSSAGFMLFENTWATRFANAIRNANGQVLLNERIPRAVIEELTAGVEI